MRKRARIRRTVARLLWAMVALALGAAQLPHSSLSHCGEGRLHSAHHHPSPHHRSNNTEAPFDCPHCPPAECARHASCETAVVATATPEETTILTPSTTRRSWTSGDALHSRSLEPPTHPPQLLIGTNAELSL